MLKEVLPCQQALRAVPAQPQNLRHSPGTGSPAQHSGEQLAPKRNLQPKEALKSVLGMSRTTEARGQQHPALSLPGDGQAYLRPLSS